MAVCRDCGEHHDTGMDAMRCDWRLGGEDRVRRNLSLQGVGPTVIDQIVSDLEEESR